MRWAKENVLVPKVVIAKATSSTNGPMKHLLVSLTIALAIPGTLSFARAEDKMDASGVTVLADIAYKAGDLSDYERERCKLDLYLPAERKGFATLLWLHGGALKGGDNKGESAIARSLARAGIAVVSAEYRLSPKVNYPAYLQDAAAAFAWTRAHIGEHGGDRGKLFIGGHSAGGYLTLMIGLDERYLRACGVELSAIAGLVPISGQTMTHYTVREERGIGQFTVVADEAAPVFYGRKDTVPMLVLYADHDMAARAEENEYFVALMKGAGNEQVRGQLIRGRTHDSIASHIADDGDPARLAIIEFIKLQANVPRFSPRR